MTFYKCTSSSSWYFKTYEPFWDLSLSISGQTSLSECLNEFQKIEHLDGDESPFWNDTNNYHAKIIRTVQLYVLKWTFCILKSEKCDKKQSMTKQIKIARCPDILILHLKRFCSSRSKYDQLVHSPTQLKVRDTQFNLTRNELKI